MNFLYQSAFAEALGWSLIDSLWQMGAVWLFYVLITGNGRKFSSQQRHTLALIGSAVGMLLFVVSIAKNYYGGPANTSYFNLPFFVKFVPFISFIYLPFVIFFGLRLIAHVCFNKTVYRNTLIQANTNIARFVTEISEQSGILKKDGDNQQQGNASNLEDFFHSYVFYSLSSATAFNEWIHTFSS